MDSHVDVSVIICTHNPRSDYLRRTLDSLRDQTLSKDTWELLLVDNASAEPLALTCDISWHPNGRHVLENELGLSPARLRGMREARSDLLIFVDDDNVLEPHYLDEAIEIKRNWPQLGTWGAGHIVPEYEQKPPDYLRKLLPYLALRQSKVARWANVCSCIEATPWGAGLCVRGSVAKEYVALCESSGLQVTDRRGRQLLSGGDVEISFVACNGGLGMGIFPQLRLTHLIPKVRVTEEYLLRIVEGTRASHLLLAYKWRGVRPRSPFSVRTILSVLANVLTKRGLNRRVFLSNFRAQTLARRAIAENKSVTRTGPGAAPDSRK
jgi:glycosyltransferase involved in cell wall biosynthesis